MCCLQLPLRGNPALESGLSWGVDLALDVLAYSNAVFLLDNL
jgi:hypothetical protein